MPAAKPVEPKPLSPFEQKLLAAVLEKLKPTLDNAVIAAKAKLRTMLGPKALAWIDKAVTFINKVVKDGPPPISANATKILAGIVAAAVAVGLWQHEGGS